MNQKTPGRDGAGNDTESPAPNAAQLRDDIDSGRTRDKVAHPDPAAAPLGTDDEAAGAPPTTEQAAMARQHEGAREVSDPAPADQPKQAGMAPSGRFVWLIVAGVVVCALVGIALSL